LGHALPTVVPPGGFRHQATPPCRRSNSGGPEVVDELFPSGLTCSTALTLSTAPPPWPTSWKLSVDIA
jgi:hypothetical protein